VFREFETRRDETAIASLIVLGYIGIYLEGREKVTDGALAETQARCLHNSSQPLYC
jgi:hypothetical protein